jgi:hypothetical protein
MTKKVDINKKELNFGLKTVSKLYLNDSLALLIKS